MRRELLTVACCGLALTLAQAHALPRINEIRIDQPGADVDEYFELTDAPGTSLDGLTYLVIGDGVGASGVVEASVDLTGFSIPASGFFVVAEASFTLNTPSHIADLNFENSDNVTHLLVSGFAGAVGADLDLDDDGVLDLSPWAEVIDSVALIGSSGTGDAVYSVTRVGPDGSFVPGHVFRCPDGGDWAIGGFAIDTTDTPGLSNQCVAPPPAVVLIHEIQGPGQVSPLNGAGVIVEAVVVGDFQNNGGVDNGDLRGFYLQEEDADADADPATSEGIFVFDPDSLLEVTVGDLVRVGGVVSEFSGLTEITAQSVEILGRVALPEPAQIALPVAAIEDFERFESMRVALPQPLVVSEYFNFDRFGEVVLAQPLPGEDRLHTPTAVAAPGSAEAIDRADYNQRARITLDDGRSTQNPDPALHPNGAPFDLDNRFRGGDTVMDTIGILDFRFGRYRIQPTAGANHVVTNRRPAGPSDVGGNLRVASFNVLNYFTTLDTGAAVCGPLADLDCRGADDATEFQRQRSKIIAALARLEADIVGLVELENNASAAIADLVDGLNAALQDRRYEFVDTGAIGGDAIKVGFIYNRRTVRPQGRFAILDSTVDPTFLDQLNRPALAQTFRRKRNDARLTVAVNHFKSKGSACDAVGDTDLGDGQGNCNLTRTLAAEALARWLATDPTRSGDPDFMVIGDLNAYAHEDPVEALRSSGYTDLLDRFNGELAYSFVFDGQFGYLDYAMANATLAAQVTGAAAWPINADEPDILDYDTSFKLDAQDALFEPNEFRASDHDPVLVGIELLAQARNKGDCRSGGWRERVRADGSRFDNQGRCIRYVQQSGSDRDDRSHRTGDDDDRKFANLRGRHDDHHHHD